MPTSFDVLLKNWLTKISNSIKGISVSGDTLTVTKTDNSTEDLTLGLQALERKIFAQSTWYKRPELMTPNKTTITIPAGTQVAINNAMYISTTSTTLTLADFVSADDRKGKDVYVYACVPPSGTEPVFVVSLNSTVPSGYTATNSRKIGGFHCECADVGVIADHPLSGYLAGDILPASVWDLLHRAVSENEGMVFIDDKWCDIYLPSYYSGALHSTYNSNVLYSKSALWFEDNSALVKKRLIKRSDFMRVAKGSNEMTNANDTSNPHRTGGYRDTNNQRMISNYGIEDCCGNFWQWTDDIWGAPNATSVSSYNGQGNITQNTQQAASGDDPAVMGLHSLIGYVTEADGRGVYNILEDGDTALNKYGQAMGAVVQARVGGRYVDGVACGSRSIQLNYLSSNSVNGYPSARLVSAPRIVNL